MNAANAPLPVRASRNAVDVISIEYDLLVADAEASSLTPA
jgi:hypothetical protein